MSRIFCLNCMAVYPESMVKNRCLRDHCPFSGQLIPSEVLVSGGHSRSRQHFFSRPKSEEACNTCVTQNMGFKVEYICPHCGFDLSISKLFNKREKVIPVLGGPYSGKTVFLSQLGRQLAKTSDAKEGKAVSVFNRRGRDYLSWKGKYREKDFIIQPESSKEFSPPIVFSWENDYRIFYDFPGIWTQESHFYESRSPFLSGSQQLIIIVDPYSILGIQSYLPEVPTELMELARTINPMDIISFLINLFERMEEVDEKGQIPLDLILVLNKADVIEHLAKYHPDKEIRSKSENLILDAKSEIKGGEIEIKDWFASVGWEVLINLSRDYFRSVRYFVTSPLGHTPFVFNSQNGGKVRPTSLYPLNGDSMDKLIDYLFPNIRVNV